MCGEMMTGKCEICGKDNVPLRRKYYYYRIKCECHSPEHFECVEYCEECVPKPPKKTVIEMKPINESD